MGSNNPGILFMDIFDYKIIGDTRYFTNRCF
jgi:hypothetical protein